MPAPILLITPPFTQLNTPYPATAYLMGFLRTRGIDAVQADLGIDVTLRLFTREMLSEVFRLATEVPDTADDTQLILAQRDAYLHTIDMAIAFLQGKQPALAWRIAERNLLPEGPRFAQLDDLEWAFGSMGVQDKAKHIATLYLEDLADLIRDTIDPFFGFSRYAERLARSANTFDELYAALQSPLTLVDTLLLQHADALLREHRPPLVAITAPFPGNVYAAFRCAQLIKQNYPDVRVAFGGGFANTELRSLTDVRVFEFFDYISLDDGEAPIERIWQHVHGNISDGSLKRTYILRAGVVQFINDGSCADIPFANTGTPDYSGLPLQDYISAIEIINPMHSLWSNGRWNKLTMAHGCYWGKCTFCDISLPYIADYEPLSAAVIVDRMEKLIADTGERGFHFVDEAAPPALMRGVALEILRRKLVVSWWTNIRFEKSFTRDLCILLKASGCIGVSGGLEVASDRLLALIQKGVTIEQVTHVLRNFTEAGIMVHAYLMYGFPTQTDQETVDSLEVVRQLFDSGVLQSGFWHRFAMTAHSPVGLQPEAFHVEAHRAADIRFADNDIEFTDPAGGQHEAFSEGLRISLYNYMQGAGLDMPLQEWFGHRIPATTVAPDHIESLLNDTPFTLPKSTQRVLFLGTILNAVTKTRTKRGQTFSETTLDILHNRERQKLTLSQSHASWLQAMLPLLTPDLPPMTFGALKENFEASGLGEWEMWWVNAGVGEVCVVL